MTTATDIDVYISALNVDEIFADPTYQRTLDVSRARKMCATWDRRLAGILEVSDRGEDMSPRYAVIDGQHRWAAAGYLTEPHPLVANVHTGLTIAEEAQLFDKLNRQRRQPNTWDHWRARRASGDPAVSAIEGVVQKHGLAVSLSAQDGCVACTSALEKIAAIDIALLDETLDLITDVWQNRRDALEASIIHGLALVLHYLRDDLDPERLVDALLDVMPRQIKTQAVSLREISPGTLPRFTAVVIVGLYNKKPGRKVEVTVKNFGGTGIVRSREPKFKFPERYRELRDLGYLDWEIAKRMDIKLRSLVRSLIRHDMPVSHELASMAVEERQKKQAS